LYLPRADEFRADAHVRQSARRLVSIKLCSPRRITEPPSAGTDGGKTMRAKEPKLLNPLLDFQSWHQ
jgi:hypothetical protein